MNDDENIGQEFEKSMKEQRDYEEVLANAGWPPSLIKASCDPFDYACKLRTGEVIYFQEATAAGSDFVTLKLHDIHADSHYSGYPPSHGLPCMCPRGVDVRISDIVWCADAPWDS